MMSVIVNGISFDTDVVSDAYPRAGQGNGWEYGSKRRVVALASPECSCEFRSSDMPLQLVVCMTKDASVFHDSECSAVLQVIRLVVGPKRGLSFLSDDPGDGADGCWAHVRKDGSLILSRDAFSCALEDK